MNSAYSYVPHSVSSQEAAAMLYPSAYWFYKLCADGDMPKTGVTALIGDKRCGISDFATVALPAALDMASSVYVYTSDDFNLNASHMQFLADEAPSSVVYVDVLNRSYTAAMEAVGVLKDRHFLLLGWEGGMSPAINRVNFREYTQKQTRAVLDTMCAEATKWKPTKQLAELIHEYTGGKLDAVSDFVTITRRRTNIGDVVRVMELRKSTADELYGMVMSPDTSISAVMAFLHENIHTMSPHDDGGYLQDRLAEDMLLGNERFIVDGYSDVLTMDFKSSKYAFIHAVVKTAKVIREYAKGVVACPNNSTPQTAKTPQGQGYL